ncbi:MAG TPA: hypothetical protein VGY99_23345 [Candidatus Binataceae bacterium]|nr:hypothetical protein [Candidatus Binataceae bacterium]
MLRRRGDLSGRGVPSAGHARNYDNGGKLWKVQVIPYIPADVYDGHMNLNSYSSVGSIIDLQNLHYSVSPLYDEAIGMDKVPGKYRDIAVMATPKGLDQVMK